MYHELLMALLGHCGDIIEKKENGFQVAEHVQFLNYAEKNLMNKVVMLGYYFVQIKAYTDQYLSMSLARDGSKSYLTSGYGLYPCAFGHGLQEILLSYQHHVTNQEKQILEKRRITLSQMLSYFQEYIVLLPDLADLVEQVNIEKAKGAQLLDILHNRMKKCGFPIIRKTYQKLLLRCNGVLYNQLLSWTIYGRLVDPFQEFFIRQRDGYCFNVNDQDKKMEHLWENQYTVDMNSIPISYFPTILAEKVLFIGKSINVLTKAASLVPSEIDAFSKAFQDLKDQEEFRTLPLECVLESIRKAVAHRLWQVVVIEGKLTEHLEAVKNYFLLGKGEFFQSFIENSKKMMRMPPSHKSEVDINEGPFQNTARSFQLEDNIFHQNVSLKLDLPHFEYKKFESIRGLSLVGAMVHDSESGVISLLSENNANYSSGAIWTCRHRDFIRNFSTKATFFLDDATINYQISFVLQSIGPHVVPLENIDGIYFQGLAMIVQLGPNQLQVYSTSKSGEINILKEVPIQRKKEVHNQSLTSFRMDLHENSSKMLIYFDDDLVLEYDNDISEITDYLPIGNSLWMGIVAKASTKLNISSWTFQSNHASIGLNGYKQWKSMGLNYRVTWPGYLILTEDSLRCYNQLFQFLFGLKKASWQLQEIWSILMKAQYRLTHGNIHDLYLLRNRIDFLIRHLLYYFQFQVIECNYQKLSESIKNAPDFDSARKSHEHFVASLIRLCYLKSRTMMEALNQILDCVGSLYDCAAMNQEQLEKFDNEFIRETQERFDKYSSYLFTILQKTNSRDLVLHLDYNGYISNQFLLQDLAIQ